MVVKLQLPPTLIIGGGASQQAAAEAQRLGIERPLLVVDPYLRDSQPAALLAAALPTAIFSGVTPDPDLDVVAAGLAALRAHDADGIVALGGGSTIDAAKAIAILATNPGPLSAYMGYHKVPTPGLPLIAIPSTAGTGSEATRVTIITDRPRNVKMMILDGYLLPAVALVDYELSLSTPAALTAAVGLDSLTHALEAYVSRKASPFSDAIALEAGRLIVPHLRRAYTNPQDLPAKEAMMTGATITPAAPASMARQARATRLSVPGLLIPTTTGTRPRTRPNTRCTKTIDSSVVSFWASPIMPRMVIPWTPFSM